METSETRITAEELIDAWPVLAAPQRLEAFQELDRAEAVREEATAESQRIGGMEALDTPDLETGFASVVLRGSLL